MLPDAYLLFLGFLEALSKLSSSVNCQQRLIRQQCCRPSSALLSHFHSPTAPAPLSLKSSAYAHFQFTMPWSESSPASGSSTATQYTATNPSPNSWMLLCLSWPACSCSIPAQANTLFWLDFHSLPFSAPAPFTCQRAVLTAPARFVPTDVSAFRNQKFVSADTSPSIAASEIGLFRRPLKNLMSRQVRTLD